MNIPFVKLFKNQLAFIFALLISLSSVTGLSAQQSSEYQELLKKSQQRGISVDRIVLPGKSDSTVTMANIFSLPYSELPFKKAQGNDNPGAFYSVAELSLEVFKSDESRLNAKNDVSVKGLESVSRSFWSDTAYADSYEESQSPEQFLNGVLATTLKPGIYSYILQMRQGQETKGRISKVRTVSLQKYGSVKMGDVIVGSDLKKEDSVTKFILSSLGKNVQYGKDFFALIHLPQYNSNNDYTLSIHVINTSDNDTSKVNTAYSTELTDAQIQRNIHPKIADENRTSTAINLMPSKSGYTYALLRIPGKHLPNAQYQLSIKENQSGQVIAKGNFRSIWIDMPASLYSLDVAIDMLKYITDDETLNRLRTGSQSERERNFRSFWEKRDPTPNTEFNELMTEYYQRIDYAYQNFTTRNTIGFNSDQGEVYIKYGQPNNIERKYPANGPTLEIWQYKNRTFVFEATSGFGDFKLVSQKSN